MFHGSLATRTKKVKTCTALQSLDWQRPYMAYTSQRERNLIFFVLHSYIWKRVFCTFYQTKTGGSRSGVGNIKMFCVMVQGRLLKCYSFKTTTPEMHWTVVLSETRRYVVDCIYTVRYWGFKFDSSSERCFFGVRNQNWVTEHQSSSNLLSESYHNGNFQNSNSFFCRKRTVKKWIRQTSARIKLAYNLQLQ